MAKIGTAHIEIKPVLNEEALDAIVQRIEDAVAAGVARAISEGQEDWLAPFHAATSRGKAGR